MKYYKDVITVPISLSVIDCSQFHNPSFFRNLIAYVVDTCHGLVNDVELDRLNIIKR